MSYKCNEALYAAFERQCTTVHRLLDRCRDGKAEITEEEILRWLQGLHATKEMLRAMLEATGPKTPRS
jgi:hypothetical protein